MDFGTNTDSAYLRAISGVTLRLVTGNVTDGHSGAAETAYRGRDRRSVPVDTALPVGRMALAVGGVALAWGIVITLLHDADAVAPAFALPLVRLDVGASLLASITAAACFLRWRLEGTSSALWAGLIVMVLGLSGFASTEITRGYAAAGVTSSIVAIGLVVVWLRHQEVDATLSTPKVAVLTGAALVAVFGIARLLVVHETAGAVLSLGIGAALLILAYVGHRLHPRDQWLLVVLVAYSAASIEYAPLALTDPMRNAAATTLHLFAMAVAAFASTLLLHEAAARQREVAFRLRVERDEAQERFADTLHEVRSTVTALEGGVSVFAPGTDPMQAVLSRALVAEIRRLRALVEDRPTPAEPEMFLLDEVLEPMLTVCVAAGQVVSWDIPAEVYGVGRSDDVVQIVHGLLTNARRHAPGSPVDVVVRSAAGFAVIRVDDRGPGVAAGRREQIFGRGHRGDARAGCEGHGLGLHIARNMARAQGGDLRVDPRIGGGASFVLTVPTVTVLSSARRDRDIAGASVWSHPLAGTELRNAQ